MRLRNIKGAEEFIASSEFVIQTPEEYKGKWNTFFGNDNPIHIEIGMGKGKFIHSLAEQNPNVNYIGIEMYSSVLYRAIEKRQQTECSNLYFIRMDAKNLTEVFDKSEVDRIYLNFSDPWPKDRHAKRRLTSRQFFARYDAILKPDGRLEFKTDNQDLFTFSLEEIPEAGWHLDASTRDLHHDSVLNEGNIMTEYEEKFSSKGNPICKLIASR
mgnify:CR=1 FL=1